MILEILLLTEACVAICAIYAAYRYGYATGCQEEAERFDTELYRMQMQMRQHSFEPPTILPFEDHHKTIFHPPPEKKT